MPALYRGMDAMSVEQQEAPACSLEARQSSRSAECCGTCGSGSTQSSAGRACRKHHVSDDDCRCRGVRRMLRHSVGTSSHRGRSDGRDLCLAFRQSGMVARAGSRRCGVALGHRKFGVFSLSIHWAACAALDPLRMRNYYSINVEKSNIEYPAGCASAGRACA